MKFIKEHPLFITIVSFLLFFVSSTFLFDNWMHFDGTAFFFHTYFFKAPYNEFDYTRLFAVYHHILPMVTFLKLGGANYYISSLLFSIGITIHILYPVMFGALAFHKKWFTTKEFHSFLSFYIVSFIVLKALSYAWFIHEFNIAHSLIWLTIGLLQLYEKTYAKRFLLISILVLSFSLFSHPISLVFSIILFFTYILKRRFKVSLLFALSSAVGIKLLIDYLRGVSEVHASGFESLLYLTTSHFYISLFCILLVCTFSFWLRRRYLLLITLISIGVLLLNYERHYFLYYIGRNPGQALALAAIGAYLLKFQFNWFPKVQLEKTVYSLIAIFSFLVLLEGFTWKGDLTALKQKLFSSSGSLSYSEINTVVPNYRSFANSWTQRMLSILLFHSEGIPVKAIIKSSSPHETDMLDFGYKLFQQSFREYGGRYDIEFNFELIKPRGEWKKN